MRHENRDRFQLITEVAAVAWLGICLVNGALALNANDEAVRAEVTATLLETQNDPRAEQLQASADADESQRNMYLFLAGLDLGIAAICGSAAVSIATDRRNVYLPGFGSGDDRER